MATAAQVTANRANAQHSTGPRSEQGKARSSQNNLRYGFRSQSVLLPGDDPAEYEELLAELTDHFDAGDLTGPVRSIDLPGPGLLQVPDDLTLGPDGALYVALNLAGAILRVDPETGDTCRVAEGIPLVSSVAFGAGPGWDPDTIYTTGFDGTVRAARPAAG